MADSISVPRRQMLQVAVGQGCKTGFLFFTNLLINTLCKATIMQWTKGWFINKNAFKGSHLVNYRKRVTWRMKVVEVGCVRKVVQHPVSPVIFVIQCEKMWIVLFSYSKAEDVINDEGFDLLQDLQYDATSYLDTFAVAVRKNAPFKHQ